MERGHLLEFRDINGEQDNGDEEENVDND